MIHKNNTNRQKRMHLSGPLEYCLLYEKMLHVRYPLMTIFSSLIKSKSHTDTWLVIGSSFGSPVITLTTTNLCSANKSATSHSNKFIESKLDNFQNELAKLIISAEYPHTDYLG